MTHATYKESAGADFLAMPKGVRQRFRDAIRLLERSPVGIVPTGLDVIQFRGTRSLYRIAVEDYRGIFRWEGRKLEFLAFGYGHEPYVRFGWP